MHLNRECAYPDLEDLFVREDVTAEVEALQPELPELIAGQLRMLAGGLPDVAIGEHCRKPYECPFMNRCWAEVPEHHVSTLYRAPHGAAALIAQGYETIAELPAGGLNAIQERQRLAVLAGRMIVEPGLAEALRVFEPPLAFLDFETVGLAIPVWDGCHPYDAVPVQFSCHRPAPDGTIAHHEWLADGPGDPRPELARALVAACRGARTVVAYNAGFERGCIERLADAVPELADDLLAIAARLADPLPVVRAHVYHPDFHGSFSLKSVLPALVPNVIASSPTPSGHCEERSDEAISPLTGYPPSRPGPRDCFVPPAAGLAMTEGSTIIASSPTPSGHCEERSDEAIPSSTGYPPSLPGPRDCFVPPAAGLAMTEGSTVIASSPTPSGHCEERSDEAISPLTRCPPSRPGPRDCFVPPAAGLAMTEGSTIIASSPTPSGHCEERSDEAISSLTGYPPSLPGPRDCFVPPAAGLAMTEGSTVIASSPTPSGHCEERSDEAIPSLTGYPPSLPGPRDCFVPPAAGLAMTEGSTIIASSPTPSGHCEERSDEANPAPQPGVHRPCQDLGIASSRLQRDSQ